MSTIKRVKYPKQISPEELEIALNYKHKSVLAVDKWIGTKLGKFTVISSYHLPYTTPEGHSIPRAKLLLSCPCGEYTHMESSGINKVKSPPSCTCELKDQEEEVACV